MICDEIQQVDDVRRTQLAENMRFLADMRFKQLTIAVAGLSAAGAGMAQYGSGEPMKVNATMCNAICQIIAVNAILFIAVFWVMEIRSTLSWRAHRTKEPDLWIKSPRTPIPSFNASNAIFAFYALQYGFWIWCTWKWAVPCWLTTILSFLGIMIFFHGAASYWGGNSSDISDTQRDISVDQGDVGAK